MSLVRLAVLAIILVGASLQQPVLATDRSNESLHFQALESFLEEFHRNPNEVMDRLPPHVNEDGTLRQRGFIPDLESPEGQRLLWDHAEARRQIIKRSSLAKKPSILALPLERDDPTAVVHDHKVIKNVFELSKAGWDKGAPSFQIWGDSYWPRNRGVIGNRYADPSFPNSSSWTQNNSYVQRRPASSYIPGSISQLSPAEKYDLLIGDRSWGLTESSWKVGRESLARWGVVPSWEGICHGWSAAASMNFTPPAGPATLTGVDGHKIKFHQSDLKGLASYLWAEVFVETNYSGRVCRKDTFKRDAVGRILDGECLDSNPSSWHLLVTNQVGRLKKSFVTDVNFDSAIWNYAVVKYRTTYFNPQSLKPTNIPKAAIVPLKDYTLDKFRSYRPDQAKYVIGVSMDVSHADAMSPHRGLHQAEPNLSTVRFVYDLELDKNFNIIGGEWYSNAHPDFSWSFEADALPQTLSDRLIQSGSEAWNLNQPLPSSWAEAARKSSAKGLPSRLIVERLIRASLSGAGDDAPSEEAPSESEDEESPESDPEVEA